MLIGRFLFSHIPGQHHSSDVRPAGGGTVEVAGWMNVFAWSNDQNHLFRDMIYLDLFIQKLKDG